MNDLPRINPQKEKVKISRFLRSVFTGAKIKRAIIGVSGGIDSTTSLYLLKEVLPLKNIVVAHLYYRNISAVQYQTVVEAAGLPQANIMAVSIRPVVEAFQKSLKIDPTKAEERLRLGNVMSRVRMIILFDLAKKHRALVCGTENKSERQLGYFTRFGDAASDIEPISHLYKLQVQELAKHLGVPKEIIDAIPTAGLWPGQTDEGELGFSYQEADPVLQLYFDKKITVEEIKKKGYRKVDIILRQAFNNKFKHKVPYSLG